MCDVLAQDLLLDTAQRGAHGADLGDDVDAVAVLFDHARETADLPLDAAQALQVAALAVRLHAVYIPPQGIHRKGLVMTDTAHAHHDHGHAGHDHHHDHAAPAAGGVIDPVCGMTVDPATTPHKHAYKGETYYFCSSG